MNSDEEGTVKLQHPKRRKSYYAMYPDAEGSPYLFPPMEHQIRGMPPNGEKIRWNTDESWKNIPPKDENEETERDRYG